MSAGWAAVRSTVFQFVETEWAVFIIRDSDGNVVRTLNGDWSFGSDVIGHGVILGYGIDVYGWESGELSAGNDSSVSGVVGVGVQDFVVVHVSEGSG